jgi:integrase
MAKSKSAIDMTARWLERLKPPETGRLEHFDQQVHGLGLRISATGHRSWFVMYRKSGDPKTRRYTLGEADLLSLADARTAARDVIDQARRGNDPSQEKQELQRAPTFKEMAQEYLTKYAMARKRSWREDQRIIERELIPAWGGRKAHDIKRREVISLLDAVNERGAPIQANRSLALVRKMYNWAIGRDLVEANPCTQVKAVAKENQRDRVLNEEEIRAVWTAFGQQKEPVATMFKLRLLTAQRGGEVETMRWADLDLDKGRWTIPAERVKNGLSHRVHLSAPALALLQALQASETGSEWVFPSPKGNQPIANIQKAAARVRELSGVRDFVMHDLRRTAATYMTSMGVPRLVVAKLLNHAEVGVTRVYDRHSYDAEKRQALDAWSAKLAEIVQ